MFKSEFHSRRFNRNKEGLNMDAPKISVIIPVYNPGKWLHECMRSVLDQSLRDIEIICIDDGSSDGSLGLLKEYALQDERVKVFSQANSGAAVARNKGLSIASGEFVAFMDPDDLYSNLSVLEILYSKAIENSVDACGGCMMQFFPDGRRIEHYSGINSGYEFMTEGIVEYSDYQFEYGYTRFIYRRKVIEEHNIRFPELLRFQDPPFFVAVMVAVKRFYALPVVVYNYRATDQSKKVDWESNDYCRARHYVQGMSMVLDIAESNGLEKLKRQEMDRFLRYGGKFLWTEGLADKIQDDIDLMINKYMPVVSVVVPIYNVEQFVGECLESLLVQKYRNLEIICINDGSTDNSLKIVESYRERFVEFCRFMIKTQPNGGLSAARNAGMELATGKYIYFLDSDDRITSEAIAELVAISESNNLDQVIFSCDVFITDENESLKCQAEGFLRYYKQDSSLCDKPMRGDELFSSMVEKNCFYATQQLRFYRLSLLREHNCRFPEGLLHEDMYFAPLSLRWAQRAMLVNRRYFQRRVRDGSIMTTANDRSPRLHGLFGIIVALCLKKDFWDGSDIFKDTLRKYISTMCLGLGWHCRDTPREKWGAAVREIIINNKMGDERITLEFILPLLRDRILEYARANKSEKEVVVLKKRVEEMSDLRQLIVAKDKRIDDLERRVKLRTKEVVERNQLITAKDKRIEGYIRDIENLKNSRSYRLGLLLTWPIRKILRMR